MRSVLVVSVLAVLAVGPAATGEPAGAEPVVERWPELTQAQQAGAIQEHKAFAADVSSRLGHHLRLLETRYMLFYTDMDQREALKWAKLLDRLYLRMGRLFGVEKGVNIWRGKLLILVLAERRHFVRVEREMFQVLPPEGVIGVCHSRSDGDVVVCFHRQRNDRDFAALLVHETAHGFLHRYRSPVPVPSWINEGLAEWISHELVAKRSRHLTLKHSRGRKEMRKSKAIGSGFFDSDRLQAWQYGVAYDLTAFMIRQDKQAYAGFIDGIKDGLAWRRSLRRSYGVELEPLVSAFGRSIGIRALTP